MSRSLIVVVGLSLGVLLGAGVWAVTAPPGPVDPVVTVGPAATPFPAVDHDPAAVDGFVAAWHRWRTSTFVARGVWTRRLDVGGAPLTLSTYTAQDPPRRVVMRGGAVVELIDGTVRGCDTELDTVTGCTAGDAGVTYDDAVAAELALVRRQVGGPQRAYAVERAPRPGCWRLELEVVAAAPAWGRWAEFCFDPDDGVMTSARIRRPSAVDEEHVVSVENEVTADDLRVAIPD